MTFHQFLTILLWRRKIALAMLGVTILTTLLVSLVMPKSYKATTTLVIDYKATDPVSGMTLPSQLMPGYMATQTDIIKSRNVALKVVDSLGLASHPAEIEAFNDDTGGNGDIREWLVDVLSKKLDVKPSLASSAIDLSYENKDPKFAAAVANAFADAYIQTSLKLKTDPSRRTAEWFSDQVKDLRDNLVKAQEKLTDNQRRSELGILQGDVATAQRVLDVAMQRFSQTHMEGQANQSEVAVLDPAAPPIKPSKPKIFLNLLISIFLGTLLAVGSALVAEMRDRRIRDPEDLSLGLDLPVLGVLAANKPRLEYWQKRFLRNRPMEIAGGNTKMHNLAIRQPAEVLAKRPNVGRILLEMGKIRAEDASRILHVQKEDGLRFGDAAVKLGLVTDDDIRHVLSQQFHYPCLPADSVVVDQKVIAALRPHDPEVEALRSLRSQLALRWYAAYQLMVVTAPSAGQGASRTAANLAVVFSQMGARTLLIDADMRNPRQHKLFRLQSSPGLSDILAGRASANVIHGIQQLTNLFVLPAGTEPPNPLELLGRPALSELISDISEQFDAIIIDTPPALESADAQTLSARAGGALIVARRHHARIADIEAVKQQLAIAGAEAVGVVLTDS